MRIDASLRIYCGEPFGVVSLSNTKENGLDASPFTAQGTFKNFFKLSADSRYLVNLVLDLSTKQKKQFGIC